MSESVLNMVNSCLLMRSHDKTHETSATCNTLWLETNGNIEYWKRAEAGGNVQLSVLESYIVCSTFEVIMITKELLYR